MAVLSQQAPDMVPSLREVAHEEVKVRQVIPRLALDNLEVDIAEAQPLALKLALGAASLEVQIAAARLFRPSASHVDLHDVHVLAACSHAADQCSHMEERLLVAGTPRDLHQSVAAWLHQIETLPQI